MARARRSSKRTRSMNFWLARIVALVALVAVAFAVWLWWDMREWRPNLAAYPEQGAVIASSAPPVRFETLAATGAQFVYLELAGAGGPPDPGFVTRLSRARAEGLEVGVVQPFDPCQPADPQSARFARMVPRDPELLPPAIGLSGAGEGCNPAVSDAAVESELTTFINQIELHAGKPVVLKLSEGFEERHRTARTTARDLWLMRDRAEPDYARRPWLLWSANSQLMSEASEEPVEWVVVRN